MYATGPTVRPRRPTGIWKVNLGRGEFKRLHRQPDHREPALHRWRRPDLQSPLPPRGDPRPATRSSPPAHCPTTSPSAAQDPGPNVRTDLSQSVAFCRYRVAIFRSVGWNPGPATAGQTWYSAAPGPDFASANCFRPSVMPALGVAGRISAFASGA